MERIIQEVTALFATDRARIATLGRASATAHDAHGLLRHHALITANRAAEMLSTSLPTARAALSFPYCL